jgi:hypothetical protein
VKRQRAYAAIVDVYRCVGLGGGYGTAETAGDAERRMANDDADMPDSSAVMDDVALRVLRVRRCPRREGPHRLPLRRRALGDRSTW